MRVYLLILLLLQKSLLIVAFECSSLKSTCEIWLTVAEKMSMTWKNIRVVAIDHELYKYNENSTTADAMKIPLNEVVTVDGYDTPNRAVIAVNETVPGPPIIAYEGQELIVHVNNHLLSDSITIHWHGLHQKETPFMDGVAYITQCPISAGQSFTYKFKANPKGTFWYHSHIGGQRVDGLFGALIIKEKASTDTAIDTIMHVGDWFHALGSQMHTRMISGYFKSQSKFVQQKTIDGVFYAPAIFKSALIEGMGQYRDPKTDTWTQSPYKEYVVEANKIYRFRVICHSLIYPFRISVDGHMLSIVASDGYDVKPRVFESFIINPGERYDFMITANQTSGDYWIRSQAVEDGNPNHYARAILRYDNTSTILPVTQSRNCTINDPCEVLNCPFSYYPTNMHTKCVIFDKLESLVDEAPPKYENDSMEVFMNFAQDTKQMNINARHFVHPGVSSLTQDEEIDADINCSNKKCDGSEICYCQYELDAPFDKTLQMVWSNHGFGSTRHHPIHLHGHSFYVLKMEYGVYNESTGIKEGNNWEIDCGNSIFCAEPKWRKNSWKNGGVPGMNLKNPPRKDTLMIPTGAFAVIRIRTDNPGKWFLHCHIEFHAMQGMAMILNEAQEIHPEPPKGFPICQNFYHNETKDTAYVKKDSIIEKEGKDEKLENILISLVIALGALSLVLFIIILTMCCVQKRLGTNKPQVTKVSGYEMK